MGDFMVWAGSKLFVVVMILLGMTNPQIPLEYKETKFTTVTTAGMLVLG
jgi:hypothetical protein